MTELVYYCKACHENQRVCKKNDKYSDIYGAIYFKFTFKDLRSKHDGTYVPLSREVCPECGELITPMSITMEEWIVIQKTTMDINVLLALDKLKKDDPIEFAIKMSQFKQTYEAAKQTEIAEDEQKINLATLRKKKKNANIPRCPTCGSTNIKKISGTKRWVTTGMFGLGSSNVGKTMQCGNCGYKF